MVKCYVCKKEIRGKKYKRNRFDYAKNNKYVYLCKECFKFPLVILREVRMELEKKEEEK
jgi:hypothetical protein